MLSRIVIFIISAIIAVIIIFVGYNFFKGILNLHDKVITITTEHQFDPTSLDAANTDNIKVKNDSSDKQIVIDADTNKTLAEVDSKKTSKRLDLPENSKNTLTLADYKDSTVTVSVGSPDVEDTSTQTPTTTTTPTPTPTPTPTATKSATPTKVATGSASTGSNLPKTGAEDYLPLVLLVMAGLYIGKYTKIYKKFSK